MALLILPVNALPTMPVRTSTRAVARLSNEPLGKVKDAIVQALLYNKVPSDEIIAAMATMVDTGQPVADGNWCVGKYILRSSHVVASWLRDAGKWRMLDGAPVIVAVAGDGDVVLETDLLVSGCDTGLRIFGKLLPASDEGGIFDLTLNSSEFFEPSEEFGITKALKKCEAELRPKLPAKDASASMALRPVFVDDTMVLLREEGQPDQRNTMTLVLSRMPSDE